MKRTGLAVLILVIIGLVALILSGCSVMGVYDRGCCEFNPPGPPSYSFPNTTSFGVYNVSGARVGTVITSPYSSTFYNNSGRAVSTFR